MTSFQFDFNFRTIMATTAMKLFQCVFERYDTIGIGPKQCERFLRQKRTFTLVILTMHFCCSTGFFLFKAETHEEISNSFCVSSTLLCCTLIFLLSANKIVQMEKLVKKIEAHIETSKFDIIRLILILKI